MLHCAPVSRSKVKVISSHRLHVSSLPLLNSGNKMLYLNISGPNRLTRCLVEFHFNLVVIPVRVFWVYFNSVLSPIEKSFFHPPYCLLGQSKRCNLLYKLWIVESFLVVNVNRIYLATWNRWPVSRASVQLSSIFSNCSAVDLPFIKPCCWLLSSSFFSRCVILWSRIMHMTSDQCTLFVYFKVYYIQFY